MGLLFSERNFKNLFGLFMCFLRKLTPIVRFAFSEATIARRLVADSVCYSPMQPGAGRKSTIYCSPMQPGAGRKSTIYCSPMQPRIVADCPKCTIHILLTVINKKAWRRSAIKDCFHRAFRLRRSHTCPRVVADCPKCTIHILLTVINKKAWRRPTLPHNCSTIGAIEFNFRVRDGNGCDLNAIITRHYLHFNLIFFRFFRGRSRPSTKEGINNNMVKPHGKLVLVGCIHYCTYTASLSNRYSF